MNIGRSRVNRLHRATDNNRTECNFIPGMKTLPVTDATVRLAYEDAFCRKCFPGGKAEAIEIIEGGEQ